MSLTLNLTFRAKLFLGLVAMIGSVGLISGAYLEHRLREWTESQVETELLRHASGARVLIEHTQPILTIRSVDPLADALARATSVRITFISKDGTVLGDSELTEQAISLAEKHDGRPEVKEALAKGHGVATRFSTTTHADTMYVAVPFRTGSVDIGGRSEIGVSRAAMSLQHVDDLISTLRTIMLLTGFIGLAGAVLISGLASHVMSRGLLALVEWTRSMQSGHHSPIDLTSRDEVGGLARSMSRMAQELTQAVTAVARERARFETVLDGLTDAVIALDETLHVTFVNQACMEMLQPVRSPVGQVLLEFVRLPGLLEAVQEQKLGQPASAELDLGGDQPRKIQALVTPLRSGAGCVIVLHDVTEIRRFEAIRRDFVANVSHELRTPITVILANAETLLAGALTDERNARGFVEALHRHAERLSKLIADLLDLGTIEAAGHTLDLSEVHLETIAKRAADTVERIASIKEQSIVVHMPAELRVRANARALEQVLVNLVDNAVKYSPSRGQIILRARQDGSRVRVEVADDGPGVEAHHRSRLFERFYRVDPARSRDVGGTGLGLAIVKHLVEAMSGTVGMEPVSPHGSLFWISLPATPDQNIA